MLKKFLLGSCILFSSLVVTACTQSATNPTGQTPESAETVNAPPASSPASSPVPQPFTARFEITTLGTKRIFTDTKYHRQSDEVYIEAPDPSTVRVTQPGVTWSEFFQTLPMSLEKDCLVTGTKQTFCSNETYTLRFFLNEQETPDALERPIRENDFLRVVYGE